jgi:hypothetical protein
VTTVAGSDQIDVRFISGCSGREGEDGVMDRRQVERHALEAEFMNSVLMYVKFI